MSWGKELWSTTQFLGVFQKTAIHREWIESVIMDNTVANEEIPTFEAGLTGYQNERTLTVEVNSSEIERLSFYLTDILGRIMLQQSIPTDNKDIYTFDWQELPAGIYVIGLHSKSRYASQLVIKSE